MINYFIIMVWDFCFLRGGLGGVLFVQLLCIVVITTHSGLTTEIRTIQ